MQKYLTQVKNIAIFILFLLVVPRVFVGGYFAYLNPMDNFEDTTIVPLYKKICVDAAIISFFVMYLLLFPWSKFRSFKLGLKTVIVFITYILLFFVSQFVLIQILGYIN